ncbi:hypothetical protein DZK27_07430 [Rhodobacteraceae bacterium 63075]|nr:hypothetical protein DZK27_07430 [Rhodobacteraceae bacterium 63075]
MFEFLKKIGGKGAAAQESQRQTVARALGEINAVLAGLEEKPVLSYDAENSQIALELPEQMPDEALALPAPGADEAPGEGDK